MENFILYLSGTFVFISTIHVTGVAGDETLDYNISMGNDKAIVRVLARGGDGGIGGEGGM